MKISVILPTYNESENIAALSQELLTILNSQGITGEVVIVDDNSPDGTGDIADALSERDNRVKVVHRPAKLGLATAIDEGSEAASHEIIVTMDSDFSHPPRIVPELVSALDEVDISIGSRYVKGGSMEGPIHKIILSRMMTTFAGWLLGLNVKDCTGGFHALRKTLLQELDVKSKGGEYDLELLYKAKERGYTMKEIPFTYKYREKGESKTNLLKGGTIYLLTAMRLVLESSNESTSDTYKE
jgi:dolichol-phosphate mannosyltransferase